MKIKKGEKVYFKERIDFFDKVPLYKNFEVKKVFGDGSFHIIFEGKAIWIGEYELKKVEKVKEN